jgi:hypothetical protein
MPSTEIISASAGASDNFAVAFAIAIGTLYCVLGYRTLKFVIGLTGFLLAAVSAAYLGGWMGEGNVYVVAGSAFVGGLCGAMALFFLYKLGVFCIGLAGALLVAVNVLSGRPEPWIIPAIIGIGLLGGLLALLIERPIMTLATAAIGAWIVVCGVAFFLKGAAFVQSLGQHQPPTDEERIVLLCWAVLGIAGMMAQFATYRPKPVVKAAPQ